MIDIVTTLLIIVDCIRQLPGHQVSSSFETVVFFICIRCHTVLFWLSSSGLSVWMDCNFISCLWCIVIEIHFKVSDFFISLRQFCLLFIIFLVVSGILVSFLHKHILAEKLLNYYHKFVFFIRLLLLEQISLSISKN